MSISENTSPIVPERPEIIEPLCPRCFARVWHHLVLGLGGRAANRKNVTPYLRRAYLTCNTKECRDKRERELHRLDTTKTIGLLDDD